MRLELDFRVRRDAFELRAACELRGRVHAVLGPSGAGKTTLLDTIAGLLVPDSGHIRLNGDALFAASKGVMVRPESRRFGYVLQNDLLFPHLSVRDNLLFGHRLLHAAPKVDAEHVIEHLELQDLLERKPAQLSGGESRRVAMGRALLIAPRLLILDEPFVGLNQELKHAIGRMIDELSRELHVPILVATHDPSVVQMLAAEVHELKDGHFASQPSRGVD